MYGIPTSQCMSCQPSHTCTGTGVGPAHVCTAANCLMSHAPSSAMPPINAMMSIENTRIPCWSRL